MAVVAVSAEAAIRAAAEVAAVTAAVDLVINSSPETPAILSFKTKPPRNKISGEALFVTIPGTPAEVQTTAKGRTEWRRNYSR